MKHQVVHALQKYVLNPPIKLLFALGIAPPGYALLETIGRKTGKARRTPVGDARVGNRLWIIAEHGMKAGYVRNIKQNPRVRLKLREGFRARWHTAAGLISGRRVTCYEHVRLEAEQAGAMYVTDEAVCDGRIVTAQTWRSHPQFYREIFARVSGKSDVAGS